jgi:hypothetical protein
MDTAAELHKLATDCATMAKASRDPQRRADWERMAERWCVLAKCVEEEDQVMLRRRAARGDHSTPRRQRVFATDHP